MTDIADISVRLHSDRLAVIVLDRFVVVVFESSEGCGFRLSVARCLPAGFAEAVHQERREKADEEDPAQYLQGVLERVQVTELRRREPRSVRLKEFQ